MHKRIVVVGIINIDLVATAPRIPVRGETITGQEFHTFFGGKGANQAVAIARLGHSVSMVGKVGRDSFGPELLDALSTAGVDTGGVEASAGRSGVAVIATTPRGENSIIVVAGANAKLLPQDLDRHRDLILGAGMVLTQLEIPMPTIQYLIDLTREAGIPLILDPAPAQELPSEVLCGLEWITPNESETCLLLHRTIEQIDETGVESAAQSLLECGVRNLVLKLGERGAFLAGAGGERTFVPAYQVQAVDTTAAGDAFNGGFAVALMRGNSPADAAHFASAVAALSVTRQGAQPSMPTAAEVAQFIAAHSRPLHEVQENR